ncbi:branched-chain amino acid ABC transporter permease [Alteribacillus sp. JSM 102045]|uniref:branched-chain amino acid ABC transporter permease n=1 Tax=Alteribacillus sp. JSM 102045 TaxID=1562101 RepID=UPI0035BF3703
MVMQQILNGLTIGSVYSLVALGLTLVYGILHVPNFAHGALYMVGGYVTLMVMTVSGAHYWIAVLASALVVALMAVLMERIVFNPLRDAPPIHDKIAAIGILLFLEALAQLMWGAEFRNMPTPYNEVVNIGGMTTTVQRLLVIGASALMMVLLYLFLKKTMIGASIIAMAQNRKGAFLVGINANKVAMMTFAISGILAAVAASLASPINLVFPGMGHLVILKAFVIIIIGGMGSIPGAILMGYVLGLAEGFGATYISNDYKDLIAFLLLVIILSIKPKGLFVKGVH